MSLLGHLTRAPVNAGVRTGFIPGGVLKRVFISCEETKNQPACTYLLPVGLLAGLLSMNRSASVRFQVECCNAAQIGIRDLEKYKDQKKMRIICI